MPPKLKSNAFIDESRKMGAYEKARCLGTDEKNNADCPGIRILSTQGMFVWMTMSWAELIVADHEDKSDTTAPDTNCASEIASMMASFICQ